MKIHEFEDEVVITLKKSEIRFFGIYGDHSGIYFRFDKLLPVNFQVNAERAFPSRLGQNWQMGGTYSNWGR